MLSRCQWSICLLIWSFLPEVGSEGWGRSPTLEACCNHGVKGRAEWQKFESIMELLRQPFSAQLSLSMIQNEQISKQQIFLVDLHQCDACYMLQTAIHNWKQCGRFLLKFHFAAGDGIFYYHHTHLHSDTANRFSTKKPPTDLWILLPPILLSQVYQIYLPPRTQSTRAWHYPSPFSCCLLHVRIKWVYHEEYGDQARSPTIQRATHCRQWVYCIFESQNK